MELVIDLGNTNKKLALFRRGKLAGMEQFPELSPALLKEYLLRHPAIERAILSSVVRHPRSLVKTLSSRFPLLELSPSTPLPIHNRYKSRKSLGPDRLAAAAGGALRFPGCDVLVITAGSCITYDFVTAGREYLGGAIAPGLQMRFEALHTFTGKLPLVSIRSSAPLTGTTSEASIRSGVMNGAAFEMEGMIARYRSQYPGLKVILSGGDQKYFDKRLNVSIFAVPNIVIHGLYQILAFNVDPAE